MIQIRIKTRNSSFLSFFLSSFLPFFLSSFLPSFLDSFFSLHPLVSTALYNHLPSSLFKFAFHTQVKKTTKMSKIMEAYAARRGLNKEALRFTLDGERIPADQTPKVPNLCIWVDFCSFLYFLPCILPYCIYPLLLDRIHVTQCNAMRFRCWNWRRMTR